MHLRDLVRQIWADHELYTRGSPEVRRFLAYVDEHPLDCVDELVDVFREQFPKAFDELVPTLATVPDPLLRVALIRRVDTKSKKEMALLQEHIKSADVEEHRADLLAVERLKHSGLTKLVKTRRADVEKKRLAEVKAKRAKPRKVKPPKKKPGAKKPGTKKPGAKKPAANKKAGTSRTPPTEPASVAPSDAAATEKASTKGGRKPSKSDATEKGKP